MKPPKKLDTLAGRPKLEVADIFRRYPHLLPQPLHSGAAKVVQDILDCRTVKLGGHVRQCDGCGYEVISYNSCRNRHCPKCQFLARAEWVQARVEELLPVGYFHVVFTLPHCLNGVFLQNKRALYGLLFRVVSKTMKKVTKTELKGADIGFIAVLHTWNQKLQFHPHLHLIVPGGGMRRAQDGSDEWVSCKQGYLVPKAKLAKVFRGMFLDELREMHPELKFYGSLKELSRLPRFNHLLHQAAQNDWVVYAKPPFAGPEQVINYLGNYTHRIAISNHRILKIDNEQVTFRYRDSTDHDKHKQMTLPAGEFMRRFLLHVLPRKFVRIRHYGFLGNRSRDEKIARCQAAIARKLPQKPDAPAINPPQIQKEEVSSLASGEPDWMERLKLLTGVDHTLCPCCKTGKMREIRVIESLRVRRRPKAQKRMDSS